MGIEGHRLRLASGRDSAGAAEVVGCACVSAASGSSSSQNALVCCLPPTLEVPLNLADACQPSSECAAERHVGIIHGSCARDLTPAGFLAENLPRSAYVRVQPKLRPRNEPRGSNTDLPMPLTASHPPDCSSPSVGGPKGPRKAFLSPVRGRKLLFSLIISSADS